MNPTTLQFVTGMKLRELHRQRRKLQETYRALGDRASAEPTPGGRLRVLYDGLREVRFAGQPLHPEVVNLDVLLHEADAGAVSGDVLALWLGRLSDELGAGRARCEFVYLFAALLEEWARDPGADERARDEGRRATRELLAAATAADTAPETAAVAPAGDRAAALATLLEGFGQAASAGDPASEAARREWATTLRAPVGAEEGGELGAVLEALAGSIYRPARLRREARQFNDADPLRKELADALTILVAELEGWDWPADGLAARALWTRNKWRLYVREGLPTACLLEIVGRRWSDALDARTGDAATATQRAVRLRTLRKIKAPQVIIDNEERMLRRSRETLLLGAAEAGDVWDPTTPDGGTPDGAQGAGDAGAEEEAAENGSVLVRRAVAQAELRRQRPGGGYDGEYGGVNQAVLLVHAEVRLARAAFPDRPVFVVKIDLQDFYATLPHDLLLAVLDRLGLAARDVEFFARFLAPALRGDEASGEASGEGGTGKPARVRRGVPMGHTLSAALAELVLRLMERFVRRSAAVRIVRLVDDLCLLAPEAGAVVEGFRRVEAFCQAAGLKVNRGKSGAACIAAGGAPPPAGWDQGLPPGLPRWGMLELDAGGDWHVHRPTFEAHLEQARLRVGSAGPVLSKVQLYNANVRFLLNALALGCELGASHRASAVRAIRQFHHGFFGEGRGIVAGLCEAIRGRFAPELGEGTGGASAGDGGRIPEAWVYWPITAGGLGLNNPLVTAGQYARARELRQPVAAPAGRGPGWNVKANGWGAFYCHLMEPIVPVDPQATKVMNALVDDFIARGATLSSGKQKGLSAYWRWVLYTYGPQILQRLGTFRFLITELVPLQLISRQRLQDASLGGSDTWGAGSDDVPFGEVAG